MSNPQVDLIRLEIERGNFEYAAELLADYEMQGGAHEDVLESGLEDWRLQKFTTYLIDEGEPEMY